MDYFEGVVADYLSADRSVFVNAQCRIQLVPGDAPRKGEHWYCDILAVDFRDSTAYLCEVTLSQDVAALHKRLREWDASWRAVRAALARDNCIPESWSVRPWLFVPEAQLERLRRRVTGLLQPDAGPECMPEPLITTLESVTPWQYASPRQPLATVVDDS